MKRGAHFDRRYFVKGFFRVFHVAAFLFITVFFILPYLVQISTYFHEKAHQAALDKYSVQNSYNVNLIETIPHFWNPATRKLGVTRFDTFAYEKLSSFQKADINLAGVISDLRFLFLIAVYLALANLYTFYKICYRKEYDLTWILAVNWILFIWLLALLQITVANVSYHQGDVYQLIRAVAG
ncbi:MAG: hypothetical protein RL557_384 [archaeon]|jgi:hypothetical protein